MSAVCNGLYSQLIKRCNMFQFIMCLSGYHTWEYDFKGSAVVRECRYCGKIT